MSGYEVLSAVDGKAREAEGGISMPFPKLVFGNGVWVAREGLDKRRTLRLMECGPPVATDEACRE